MAPEPVSTPREVRLASLHTAIAELDQAVDSDEEQLILIKIQSAMAALYALFESIDRAGKSHVDWAGEDPDRRTIVGLVFARGEAVHRGEHVAMAVGYGEAPYGHGPYGGGWAWRECPTDRDKYRESAELYNEHVRWEAIAHPLKRALDWFTSASNEP